MKPWIVLLVLAGPAGAVGRATVNFDGAPALSAFRTVEGTPFMRCGPTLIDTRAPGAAEWIQSAASPERLPIVGIFEARTARVVNAFVLGSFGVRGHSDALPLGRERGEHGGYTLLLGPDGGVRFRRSGSLAAPITPAVERSILRFVGARPAEEALHARLLRAWLRFYDEARLLLGGW